MTHGAITDGYYKELVIIRSEITRNVKCVCFALRSVGVLRIGDLRELVITGSVIKN